ncbi:MAG: hypothetical protein QM733_05235 [Ilumatobacteraceae bacterium]
MGSSGLSRRRLLGGLIAAPIVVTLHGCSSDGAGSGTTEGTSPGSDTPGTSAGSTTTGPAGTTAATVAPASGWASGGTELITVDFPATSIFATAATCTVSLTQGTTEGPCYFQADTSDDISLGKTGLPMQLCLQLVDEACTPLADHTVEVWNCDTRGIYSGDTSASDDASRFAGSFCTDDDAESLKSTYLRGQATTDADGRVNFKTIFPGWYRGRTIHIHFAVSDPDGTTRVISQWCYPDALTEEICTTLDLYADRGVQDTTLASGTDTVFPADYEPFVLSTQANGDGTMLSYGVIQIDPTAVATEASSQGGQPGGGGGGGQPPGGGGGQPPGGGSRP